MKESISVFQLHAELLDSTITQRPKRGPTIHIARGFQRHLPLLAFGRPIVCISDWQYETNTQESFWQQATSILNRELPQGCLKNSIVIIAGDMASCNNTLRGAASNDVPEYEWLCTSFSKAHVFAVYGNHDIASMRHLKGVTNQLGSHQPYMLPHGGPSIALFTHGRSVPLLAAKNSFKAPRSLQTPEVSAGNNDEHARNTQGMTKAERKAYYTAQNFTRKHPRPTKTDRATHQYSKQHPESFRVAEILRSVPPIPQNDRASENPLIHIGGVHGIPASHSEGLQKLERSMYEDALHKLCRPNNTLDILVTHSNPCLPGQETRVLGDDPKVLYEAFLGSQASLHVHGHHHTDPAVSVPVPGKVVVNSDCRLVVLLPDSLSSHY